MLQVSSAGGACLGWSSSWDGAGGMGGISKGPLILTFLAGRERNPQAGMGFPWVQVLVGFRDGMQVST